MKWQRTRILSSAAALASAVFLSGAASPSGPGSPSGSAALDGPDEVAPVVLPSDSAAEVGWRLLAQLNYRTGEKSDSLEALNGQLVKIPGFTVPLEDFASTATEFLLVPYVGACVHTPPPPPNQLVYIEMDGGRRAQMDGWNPVWVEGILEIEMTESVYGYVGFTVSGLRVYPYDF